MAQMSNDENPFVDNKYPNGKVIIKWPDYLSLGVDNPVMENPCAEMTTDVIYPPGALATVIKIFEKANVLHVLGEVMDLPYPKNDNFFPYPEALVGKWPKCEVPYSLSHTEERDRDRARSGERADAFARDIMELFKGCTSSMITLAQYNNFTDRIQQFNKSERRLRDERTDCSIQEENSEIAAIWEVFAEAKFSVLTQELLQMEKFTAGMNKVGLLPHEAAVMLAANDDKVSFLKLNTWLLKLPPTYNLTPTTQRYKDSCVWTRGFTKKFTKCADHRDEMTEVFLGAQFQAKIHGITLDRSDWVK